MTTLRQAQRAIDRAGVPLEIVRGEGYHYFIYTGPAYRFEATADALQLIWEKIS